MLFALILILFDEWPMTGGGDYNRTPLFSPIHFLGLNVAPIEFFVFLCSLPLLPNILRLLITKSIARHPVLCALVLFDFGMGMVAGRIRLGTLAGLSEIKTLLLLIFFVYLSTRVIARRAFHRAIPLLCWACIFQSIIHIYLYLQIQDIDLTLGFKTPLNIIPGLLLPLYVARMFGQPLRSRFLYGSCIVLVLYCTYLSQTRAFLVIALGGVLLTAVFCKLRQTQSIIRITRFIPAAGLIVVVLFLASGLALINKSDFVHSFIFWESQQNVQRDASDLAHFEDIQRGILLISENPITGMGFGGKLPGLGTADFEVVHNEFLEFWILFGIGGAILWLYMFAVLPVQFISRLDRANMKGRGMRDEHYLIFSLLGSVVAHAAVLPAFLSSVPQIWMTGLYLATLTSLSKRQRLRSWIKVQSRKDDGPSCEVPLQAKNRSLPET